MQFDLAVIGGGPAGLMAAGMAAKGGLKVLLLERMSRTGRKLRITGKGRCNLTNVAPITDFIQHFGKNGKFLRQAFYQFFTQDLIDFFNELGVETVVERGNRVFPASGSAVEVTDALIKWVVRMGVEIRNESRVSNLELKDNLITSVTYHIESTTGHHLHGNAQTSTVSVRNVILATGGMSYPLTGSTGDGYLLAEKLGHHIIPPMPALVPLLSGETWIPKLEGLTLRNVKATLYLDNQKTSSEFGEMEFRDGTVCGPIILSMSGKIVEKFEVRSSKFEVRDSKNTIEKSCQPSDFEIAHTSGRQNVIISVDLKPALDFDQLDTRILREIDIASTAKFEKVLETLLPLKFIPVCVELTNINPHKPSNQVTAEERKRLRLWLKDFRVPISGYRDWNVAIVTHGGIDLKEVNPKTMASKLIPNLYFAGEILDLDADTGGYNLQAAFSTGWIAGNQL